MSSSTPKKLLQIEPGSYFKVAANEVKVIRNPTTGLLVTSYESDTTGDSVYNVALVQGELLLIPIRESDPSYESNT